MNIEKQMIMRISNFWFTRYTNKCIHCKFLVQLNSENEVDGVCVLGRDCVRVNILMKHFLYITGEIYFLNS